jgi:haloalkane dehalogenase
MTSIDASETAGTAPKTIAQHRARLKRLAVQGGEISYVETGPRDGQAILLLHGIPTSSWLYRKVIPRLTAQGFHVVAPDLLGWGASDKPANAGEYVFERQAGRIKALLDALGIERATFVVHDLGGPWTWEIAKHWPELIERLVVLNTTAYRDGITPPKEIKMVGGPMGPSMLAMMRSRLAGRKMIGDFIKQFVGHADRIDGDVIEGYWTSLHEGTPAFLQMARSFGDFFTRMPEWQAAIERLTIPSMVIWGEQDRVLNAEKLTSQFARSLQIPAERVHIFEDSGHFIQEDRPEDLARLVAEFVIA